jgi:anti-sigma factor RsiW
MNICNDCQKMLADLIEGELTPEQTKELVQHLNDCRICTREYEKLKKLYGLMDQDEIELPPREFFERMRSTVKEKAAHRRRFPLKDIARILVPAFAAAAILVLIFRPANNAVEWSIPVSSLIEDEDVAYLAIKGIVTEDVAEDLISLEDQLSFDTEEEIEGLTSEEKKELIDIINQKYTVGT